MAALVAEFDKELEMDFSTVGQLVVRVKETRPRINRQLRENLKEVTMIPNHEGFRFDKVEALLCNIFMDKIKSQIQAMQARIVAATYVAKADCPKMKKDRSIGLGEKEGSKKKAKSMREEITADVALMQPIRNVEVAAVAKGTLQEPGQEYGTTLTSDQAQHDADEQVTSPPSSPTPLSLSSAMSDNGNNMDKCEQGHVPSHSVKQTETSSRFKEASMDIKSTAPAAAAATV
ncbi:hypothetical protein PHMEG_00031202, partial [Phytophthora megakarya]